MARGRAHSPEVKAAAMAALLAGQGVDQVARDYHLPRGTLNEWSRQLRASGELVQTQKSADLGGLLADYLTEVLTTLAVQARLFRDAEWIRKQDAADAAVLHGVLTDKAIRLLAALEPAGDDRP